ncbi:efflux RND transporter permease subunit [Persicobacter psychrovividus]|uniref:Multidrug efflux pump subunit AcrB n=1 Tax=Persicobacter psychrovividus TaxID=387638 RepID=A0ABM7VKR2_9BACT|nr:hypothetical protein PEPS_38560 [Persicobacter psychrovividus]
MELIKSAILNRQVTLTLTFMILCGGLYALLHMSRREDPQFNIRQGLVVVAYPGAGSLEVEQQVVRKVEELLFTFKEVRKAKTFSNSRAGLGYIVVELEKNVTDPEKFWSKLQHELNTLKKMSLPPSVLGPVVETGFGETIALLIGVRSEQRDQVELSTYLEKIENQLRTIPEVSKIQRVGEQTEAIYIESDLTKLSQYGISMTSLFLTLRGENYLFPAGKLNLGAQEIPLHEQSLFSSTEDIRNQIIGQGPEGATVRVRDVGTVERRFKKADKFIRVNGEEALLLSIEMLDGNNIVDFGDAIAAALQQVKPLLPEDIKIDFIVNQPKNVEDAVDRFIEEFFIAIVAVVIVIILLLPFRVAVISAVAIPVTVALTFTLLQAFGIELQQVSLAALIVVLGMLVDDAIVIADNYVEKLDEGKNTFEAAWSAANELKIPVLTASLTIIGSFLPLVILTGYVGEFIYSLPITVAIAISSSYLVAMFLTPLLCHHFIKKGLNEDKKPEKKGVLDRLQDFYNYLIEKSFAYTKLTILFSLLFLVVGGIAFLFIHQKLFPAAEKDQFVIELFMPEGTNLETTNKAIKEVERRIAKDERMVNYTTFVGQAAPRFYYNFSPEFPKANYAQVLVNTISVEATQEMVSELEKTIDVWVPEGIILAKQMQQGVTHDAPVEVRIFGDDLKVLQNLGVKVEAILNKLPTAYRVESDFKNPYFSLDLEERKWEASRLGITNASIAKNLQVALSGFTVSNFYEGNKVLDIIIEEPASQNDRYESVGNTYIVSPLSREKVPSSLVADVSPSWQISNLKHRNGRRTLTVLCRHLESDFPSEQMAAVRADIESIPLPPGYMIEYGGEFEDQNETFSEMYVAVALSVVLIFMIILLQFRDLKEVFLVLVAIPFCVPGAMIGLSILGYPFGFTAFVGLASLAGVTVRNSIILVDYANFLRAEGHDVREAAILAGERRIRPIFLTTLAAAVGVVPMIISGSEMWAPLATVIAFGLVFAMFMTLIVVPVLYYLLLKEDKTGNAKVGKTLMLLLLLLPVSQLSWGQVQEKSLSLDEALLMAYEQNPLLQAAALKLEEKSLNIKVAKSLYYPQVRANGSMFYWYNTKKVTDAEISLVDLPIIGSVPPLGLTTEFVIPEQGRFAGYGSVGVFQPVSQLFKIGSGVKLAALELEEEQASYSNAVSKVTVGVTKLYLGMLIEKAKLREQDSQLALTKEKLKEATDAVENGHLLQAYEYGLKAETLQQQSEIRKINTTYMDYQRKFAQLLSWPVDSITGLQVPTSMLIDSLYQQLGDLQTTNTDLKKADLLMQKAELGWQASKQDFIPDLTLFATGLYVGGVPVMPELNVLVGVNFNWTILSWGSRNKEVEIRKLQMKQAALNLQNELKEQAISAGNAEDQLKLAEELLTVAKKAVFFREEVLRVKGDAFENELITKKDLLEAKMEYHKSERQLLEAQLNLLLKKAELVAVYGKYGS